MLSFQTFICQSRMHCATCGTASHEFLTFLLQFDTLIDVQSPTSALLNPHPSQRRKRLVNQPNEIITHPTNPTSLQGLHCNKNVSKLLPKNQILQFLAIKFKQFIYIHVHLGWRKKYSVLKSKNVNKLSRIFLASSFKLLNHYFCNL